MDFRTFLRKFLHPFIGTRAESVRLSIFQDDVRQAEEAIQYYLKTADLFALDDAIAAWARILKHPVFQEANKDFRLAVLNNAGTTCMYRYLAKGQLPDLNNAIEFWEQAIILTSEGSLEWAKIQANLGVALNTRFEVQGELTDLDTAIEALHKALTVSREGSPEWASMQVNLGLALRTRFETLEQLDDLNASIEAFRKALAVVSEGTQQWARWQSNLGVTLTLRFKALGQIADLEAAIEAHQKALAVTYKDAPEWADMQGNLGIALHTRFEALERTADLESAINAFQNAITTTYEGTLAWARWQANLGIALRTRFEALGQVSDLEKAIDAFYQALALAPKGSPAWARWQTNLEATLSTIFKTLTQMTDLDEAIAVWERIQNHPALQTAEERFRLTAWNNAGNAYIRRYLVTGRLADLNKALELLQYTVNLTPDDSTNLPSRLNNLASSLYARYNHTGHVQDLEEAITLGQRAANLISEDDPNLPNILSSLALGLHARYKRTGSLQDLENAISLWQRAANLAAKDDPNLSGILNNLALGLHTRHKRTGSLQDLEDAISLWQRTVKLTPEDSPNLLSCLNNLALSLRDRYNRTRDLDDLQQAITHWQRAVNLTSEDFPELPSILSNLALGMFTRYSRTHRIQDLDEAITQWQRAANLISVDVPARPNVLGALALGLDTRYKRTGNHQDLTMAIEYWQQSIQQGLQINLEAALTSARSWGRSAFGREAWEEANQAYEAGRQAINRLLEAQLLRSGKENWLRDAQALPTQHAYALVQLGRLPEAVEALEGGRARLLAEALERNRRDLERLADLGHGDLLARYRALGEQREALIAQLEGRVSPAPGEAAPDPVRVAEALRQVDADLKAVIAEIRSVPGYEDFLLPPTFEKIAPTSWDTPLVYLLATPAGGLALIVHRGEVQAVELPALTEEAVREHLVGSTNTAGYLGAYHRWRNTPTNADARAAWHRALDTTTQWLWEAAMGAVVHTLTQGGWSRAVLVPTGYLALLPLHAAWTEDATRPTGRRYALDALTFTYAPSATALGAARQAWAAWQQQPPTLLAVDNPDGTLHFSALEVQAALDQPGWAKATPLVREAATAERVAAAMREHTVWHFSCHGLAGWTKPLKSRLQLADGPWTARDILDEAQQRAWPPAVALLSACEVGVPGLRLPEEVIGLPAVFLQAGAAGVVATLWSVAEVSTALLMARCVELWREDGLPPAQALRQAQIWLRDGTVEDFRAYLERYMEGEPVLREATLKWLSPETAERFDLHLTGKGPRFAHPFYWAAFTYTGPC